MFTNSRKLKELSDSTIFTKGEQGYKVNDDGRAIINVGAEKYDDIFSPYCYKGGDSIRGDLVEYINKKAECVPLPNEIEIIFHVKEANESKRKEISDAIKENFENDIRAIDKRIERNTNFSISILVVGIILFIAYITSVTFNLPFVFTTMLEISSWVFIWESLDAFFLDRRMLKLEKLKKYRLLNAPITIREFEVY